MIGYLLYHSETGCIEGFVTSLNKKYALLNRQHEFQSVLKTSDVYLYTKEGFYVVESELLERPPKPTVPKTGVVDLKILLDNVVVGAKVTLVDVFEYKNVFTYDPDDPIIFTDAGVYTLYVKQPFPYHDVTQEIEITNA